MPAFDFDKFERALGDVPLVMRRDDNRGIRVVLDETDFPTPVHSHLTIEDEEQTAGELLVRYDLFEGPHGSGETGLLKSHEAFTLLVNMVPALAEPSRGVLSSSAKFDSGLVRPALPLPLAIGPLPFDGRPEIAGVDFNFQDVSDEQPLLRVFMTTYQTLNRIVLKIMMRYEMKLDRGLGVAMMQAADARVRQFLLPGAPS
jgi:hypothetical protein